MKIVNPSDDQIPALRDLWQEAFGDSDDFLDLFFHTAYSPHRCRCVVIGDRIAAVLYWFDCTLSGQKAAYIYAVATARDYRGQGLCRSLMEDTHALMATRGYDCAVLVPQKEGLRAMYAGMGYTDAGGRQILCREAGNPPVRVRSVSTEEFARLRKNLLPPMGVVQEGENLTFLEKQMEFYCTDALVMAAWQEDGILHAAEYLGDPDLIPGILSYLGFPRGEFRMPGTEPFAMWHPLKSDAAVPEYFGFAFD